MLPERREANLEELEKLWSKVSYLIIDEVSMIGAYMLSQISARLQRAKGAWAISEDLPFGGVNVIFTGDFGQLSHRMLSLLRQESCRCNVWCLRLAVSVSVCVSFGLRAANRLSASDAQRWWPADVVVNSDVVWRVRSERINSEPVRRIREVLMFIVHWMYRASVRCRLYKVSRYKPWAALSRKDTLWS